MLIKTTAWSMPRIWACIANYDPLAQKGLQHYAEFQAIVLCAMYRRKTVAKQDDEAYSLPVRLAQKWQVYVPQFTLLDHAADCVHRRSSDAIQATVTMVHEVDDKGEAKYHFELVRGGSSRCSCYCHFALSAGIKHAAQQMLRDAQKTEPVCETALATYLGHKIVEGKWEMHRKHEVLVFLPRTSKRNREAEAQS